MSDTHLYHVRWAIRKDWPAVLAIDSDSYQHPLTPQALDDIAAEMSMICKVATYRDWVVGHMCYSLQHGFVALQRLAVAPGWRRKGVATALLHNMEHVLDKTYRRRSHCEALVDEEDLRVQRFLKHNGWRATHLWPPLDEDIDGPVGLIQFEWWPGAAEGQEVIRRILQGDARVLCTSQLNMT